MLTDTESQCSSCFLNFWWHQLAYMQVEPVEEIDLGALRGHPRLSLCTMMKVVCSTNDW